MYIGREMLEELRVTNDLLLLQLMLQLDSARKTPDHSFYQQQINHYLSKIQRMRDSVPEPEIVWRHPG